MLPTLEEFAAQLTPPIEVTVARLRDQRCQGCPFCGAAQDEPCDLPFGAEEPSLCKERGQYDEEPQDEPE